MALNSLYDCRFHCGRVDAIDLAGHAPMSSSNEFNNEACSFIVPQKLLGALLSFKTYFDCWQQQCVPGDNVVRIHITTGTGSASLTARNREGASADSIPCPFAASRH